ncbi:18712_t:CDS:1, partial [Racocetra fulgida]
MTMLLTSLSMYIITPSGSCVRASSIISDTKFFKCVSGFLARLNDSVPIY